MVPVGELTLFENGTYCVNEELPIAPEKLMQYTGLRDKNGKEIYEGDVVLYLNCTNDAEKAAVRYYEDDAGFYPFGGCTCGDSRASSPEVIGNIYENPELLTK